MCSVQTVVTFTLLQWLWGSVFDLIWKWLHVIHKCWRLPIWLFYIFLIPLKKKCFHHLVQCSQLHAWGKGKLQTNFWLKNLERPLGKARYRWEDNTKMDLRELGCGSVIWIKLGSMMGTSDGTIFRFHCTWNIFNSNWLFLRTCSRVGDMFSERSLKINMTYYRII